MAVEVEPKARKPRPKATEGQRKATVLRSDAARLERIAMDSTSPEEMLATAAKLRAQANTLAPTAPKPAGAPRPFCSFVSSEGVECKAKAHKDTPTCFSHTDPLTKLTDQEWQAVEAYLMSGDFRTNLLQVTSWRRLKEITTPVSASA